MPEYTWIYAPGSFATGVIGAFDDNIEKKIVFQLLPQMTISQIETDRYGTLFAAAPDLLEACEALLKFAGIIEERSGDYETNLARQAITKATNAQ